MIENNIPEEQQKTIEVLLNKKAPKRHSSEKRKLVFITAGVLTAIAAPVTVAAVLVTKAHTDKSSTQQKYDELLKFHSKDIRNIIDKMDANRTENSNLVTLRDALLNINKNVSDAKVNDMIVVAGTMIKDRIDELQKEFDILKDERKQAENLITQSTNPSQVVETIYNIQ